MGASQTATTQALEEEKQLESIDETMIETPDINDIKYNESKDYRRVVVIRFIKYSILIHCKHFVRKTK